ncbi:MAG: amidohydrolase family protein [Candidatus Marinimicrobia bacterium]|mgnify:FL=1|nr:amidohydrolase family protein [Candidatus Neomarinimicrobiota bacterium]MDP7529023.1 amidohydrolase family protein [Candidatus Neomarinimicrobiota bacterium]MDP7715242.1 amidohydrolase family protein [Candidatus Neomarinimicrobiota bacterium]
MTMLAIIRSVLFLFIILIGPPLTGQYTNSNEATILLGQGPNPAPDRRSGEGEGPFERLIIRGGTLIDGTGGPPRGPVDIVIENNQIIRIASVGTPFIQIDEDRRPKDATYELDAEGMYILPGFVDLHIHSGNQFKAPDAEYTYKLWLAHGITTVRGVALGPMEWTLSERDRSAKNEIVAPRIYVYERPGNGEDWKDGSINDPETARKWVRYATRKGVDGLKLGAFRPDIMEALLDEAKKQKLGSTAHLAQTGVAQMNAIDAARLGLGAMTHYYGLFEALYKNHDVQPWPVDMNYTNEQDRFGQVARQWNMIHERGSDEWDALLKEFKELDFILDPTMTAYLASRDVMRARNADWHEKYTLPSQWEFYQPSRVYHGSYYYDWTTWDEVAWKNFYRVWMSFLNDYKNIGGRVTVSSDAGYIYNLYGFSTIEEMELLQEAGFHPLEIFRGATMHGAQAIFDPKGEKIQFGVVRAGMLADLAIVGENPVQNLKVLYGTGAVRLNDETGRAERVGGILYTVKDGIIYDAKQLRKDVEKMVRKQKRERGVR